MKSDKKFISRIGNQLRPINKAEAGNAIEKNGQKMNKHVLSTAEDVSQ